MTISQSIYYGIIQWLVNKRIMEQGPETDLYVATADLYEIILSVLLKHTQGNDALYLRSCGFGLYDTVHTTPRVTQSEMETLEFRFNLNLIKPVQSILVEFAENQDWRLC